MVNRPFVIVFILEKNLVLILNHQINNILCLLRTHQNSIVSPESDMGPTLQATHPLRPFWMLQASSIRRFFIFGKKINTSRYPIGSSNWLIHLKLLGQRFGREAISSALLGNTKVSLPKVYLLPNIIA